MPSERVQQLALGRPRENLSDCRLKAHQKSFPAKENEKKSQHES